MSNVKMPIKLNILSSLRCCDNEMVLPLADATAKRVADLLKALAHPARLQILDILSQHAGEICACDFEGLVGLPDKESGQRPKQPTISHHLRVLRKAGLIESKKHGLWVHYFIRREQLEQVQSLLNRFLK